MIGRVGRLAFLTVALGGYPAFADFLTISPAGTSGPGGLVTYTVIGPADLTSANALLDFTAAGAIPVAFTASDSSPLSLYGSAVNDTGAAWNSFTASITGGSATFQNPNMTFDPHGTYTTALNWSVTLEDGGRTALFTGGQVVAGDSFDYFLGLVVSDPSAAVTVSLTPGAVPEPTGLLLTAVGLAILGIVRGARRLRAGARGALVAAVALLVPVAARAQGPQIDPAYANRLQIRTVGTVSGSPTQLAFGPGGRLYVRTLDAGVISFVYDAATGALTSPLTASPNIRGIGLAFHRNTMYLSSDAGGLRKLGDANGNGVWGEPGELDVTIVTGIPVGDHSVDQIQVVGDTLYVGIGLRTINGQSGAWTSGALDDLGGTGFFGGGIGRTYGDSAYNGTIAWIRDLNAVIDAVGSANAWNTNPPVLSRDLIQHDAGPFTNTGAGKLVVHSAGTRNPFGLCLDAGGDLWFTNNFNRTATQGNGRAGFGLRGDQLGPDLSREVHDQLFHASPGADYGYSDVNWRGVNPMLSPSTTGYHRVRSTTFDNLFNRGPYALHDPAHPDGLGPSASADGCAFAYSTLLPAELRGNVFVARYNGTITETPGGLRRSLTYSDVVAVDVAAGKVRRVAFGLPSPVPVLADDAQGRILIGCVGDNTIRAIQPIRP
jgi:hypothetical protein